jgi:hypothetical protein
VTLFYDGEQIGSGRVERTAPSVFSLDETTDVGRDSGTQASPDYDNKKCNLILEGTIRVVSAGLP